jgi:DNA-binding transcriptional ArsR family regulator
MTNQLDQVFSALADPTRRAVVEQLAKGPAPVSTLYEPHDMALPTFLKHLKILETSGLTQSEKNGRVRTVSIRADQFDTLDSWLNQQRSAWSTRLDRLTQLAHTLERTKS